MAGAGTDRTLSADDFSPAPAAAVHTRPMPDSLPRQILSTILLIDDDLVTREVVATMLTLGGYDVHAADQAETALELLASGECVPSVILMDVQMPGLSGASLIAELRTRSRAAIIVISATPLPARDSIVAAADGFLLKPFGAGAVQKLIEKRKTRAAPVAAAAPGSDEPVVNAATLSQFRSMMSEAAVRQVYAAMVADLDKRIAALEAAIAQGDLAEVRRIGHAIKGACGMTGALRAARIGALIEAVPAHSKGNQFGSYSALIRDLRAAIRDLEDMLKAEFLSV